MGLAYSAELLFGAAAVEAPAAEVPTATNEAPQNAIKALFRPGDRIPGGTAGAIRNELLTGNPTGGKFHLLKGIRRARSLAKILKREALSDEDRATAEKLLQDLEDAIKTANEKTSQGH